MESDSARWIIGLLVGGIGILWAAFVKLQADRVTDAKETATKCEAQVTVLRQDVQAKTELLNKLADGFADLNRTLERMERALTARARRAP